MSDLNPSSEISEQLPTSVSEGEGASGEMHLLDHIAELRSRLIHSVAAILIGAVCAFFVSNNFFEILAVPFRSAFEGFDLIGTGPAEAFILRLKVSFFAGLLLVSPYIFYQIWLFVAPGLYEHERRIVFPFILATTSLLLIGVSFCYFIVLPFAFDFFLEQYQIIGVTPTIRISEQLDITLKAMIGFGIVFEFPVLAYFLGRLGIITDTMLIEGMRYAVVFSFLIAAFLTPPDVLTQFLMAGPLMVLYTLSIYVVRFSAPKEDPESKESS